MNDEVAVGDLNSAERGSGARKNAGKPQWHQLPVFVLNDLCRGYCEVSEGVLGPRQHPTVLTIISDLGQWQQALGGVALQRSIPVDVLSFAMGRLLWLLADEQGVAQNDADIPLRALGSTVRVLEFGAKKYKVGNWAKGMPWSVCLSCALSHLFAAAGGERNDAESGLSHLAHAMCNLMFLKAYETLYPEGDDRILEFALPTGSLL